LVYLKTVQRTDKFNPIISVYHTQWLGLAGLDLSADDCVISRFESTLMMIILLVLELI